jgi:hypothetical protein
LPNRPETAHERHVPVQALSQQKPSTQKAEAHSPALLHF